MIQTNGSKRVLVTGNLGYVGGALTAALQNRGHEVIGYDAGYFAGCEFSRPVAPNRQILKDVRSIEPQDVQGVDAVIHLAGLSNDPMGELDPDLTDTVNRAGSIKVAEVTKRVGARRFIFASSCSMYGATSNGLVTEECDLRPLTAYARSKVMAERAISEMATDTFSPVFLRKATIYGRSPFLRFDLVLNNFVGWAVTTGVVKLLSEGSQWRPLLHIEDACRAYLAAIEAPREVVHNQAFNIGQNSDNCRIIDLAETASRVVPGSKVDRAEGADADQRSYRVDFTKAVSSLPGFCPTGKISSEAKHMYRTFVERGLTETEFRSRRYTRLLQIRYLLDSGELTEKLHWRSVSGA